MNNNELDVYRYKVDFAEVKNYIDIHEILMRDLGFPDYYGGHLDALLDCLTDMLGDISYIEIYNLDKIKKFDNYDKRLIDILKKCKHEYGDKYSDRFFVIVVHKDGTIEEIK